MIRVMDPAARFRHELSNGRRIPAHSQQSSYPDKADVVD